MLLIAFYLFIFLEFVINLFVLKHTAFLSVNCVIIMKTNKTFCTHSNLAFVFTHFYFTVNRESTSVRHESRAGGKSL